MSQTDIVITQSQKSQDDLIHKYLFIHRGIGGVFETSSFFIFPLNRHDLCISCMAGCPMGCTMCATTYSATPFERILTSEEMVYQIAIAVQNRVWISNRNTQLRIGFMGNGDPLANFDNVRDAIKIISEKKSIVVKEYCLSTISIIDDDQILKLLKLSNDISIPIKLQYSLFSTDENVRRLIIPNGLPLHLSVPFLDMYAQGSKSPVRYNVPLISGVNDSPDLLERLAQFVLEKPDLRRLKLSVYNTFPGSPFSPCSDEKVCHIYDWMTQKGIQLDLFFGNRNDNLLASCGQLRASTTQR